MKQDYLCFLFDSCTRNNNLLRIFVAKGIDLEFSFCVIFSSKIRCLVVAEIYEMCRLVLAVLKFVTFSAIAPVPRGLLRPASIQLSNLISTFSLGVRHPTK